MAATDRQRMIERRITDRYLASRQRQDAHNDAADHLRIELVRGMYLAVDAALDSEGMPPDTRNRVLFRLLYGNPPEVLDEAAWRKAANQMTIASKRQRELIDSWCGHTALSECPDISACRPHGELWIAAGE